MVRSLEVIFPGLVGSGYRVTSPADQAYNCVSWAAGVVDAWWWPVGNHPLNYWPPGVPRDETVDAFSTLGYGPTSDVTPESGHVKVAIYADSSGCPTHVTRQLPNGRWTSKL